MGIVIVLMVFLGAEKLGEREDLCDDRPVEGPGSVKLFLKFLRELLCASEL